MSEDEQPPHPLRCETCENNACEYWEESPHMSAGHDEQTGWRASPGVITFAVGCASHSAASQQRIDADALLEMQIALLDSMQSQALRQEPNEWKRFELGAWFEMQKAALRQRGEQHE